jgi:signal transduction histidine kinase
VGFLGSSRLARAAETAAAHSPKDVRQLAARAGEHIEAAGRDRAFSDFSSPQGGFVDGELYIFCRDAGGTVLAHGGNPRLMGKNLPGVRDPRGKPSVAESIHIGMTEGHGRLAYLWPNPETRRVEREAAFVVRTADRTVCGSGYHEPAPK